MDFKSQFFGLSKKVRNARNNGFIINQKVKLTLKIDSSLSNINKCYSLKFQIPMCH